MTLIFRPRKNNRQQIKKARGRTAWRRGHVAELIACLILRMKGYRIQARRYKTTTGEIDIIARRGHTLCFVEVKSRTSFAEAAYSITPAQKKRICRTAAYYLSQHPFPGITRFDTILFKSNFAFTHLQNVWGI